MEAKKDSLGIFKGREKKDLQRHIDQMKEAQKVQYDRLNALGVAEPSQAHKAIEENQYKDGQEKEKSRAYAEEVRTARQRAVEAKEAYRTMVNSIPADKVTAVKEEQERGRNAPSSAKEMGLSAYSAEIAARRELDSIGTAHERQERTKTHEYEHEL